MTLEISRLTADAGFWPAAARAVCTFAATHGAKARQMQTVTWVVPRGPHAALARTALRTALGNEAFIPPRIAPFGAWLGHSAAGGTAARAEIFTALRANAWVRGMFGVQPAAIWALASGIAQLCDELSWAALDDADALAARLQASLARHFQGRALRALLPESQLVLQLWRARRSADDGAQAALRELQVRADAAHSPLAYVATDDSGQLQNWEHAFLHRYSARAPVLLFVPDVAAALAHRPILTAAWPELTGSDPQAPLATRADDVAHSVEPTPLTIFTAHTLEQEATAVAAQVLDWLRAGTTPIALVALDRLTARRVRALLERARVTVRDETGWKLSTTSAAAAVMRWLDLAADDLYWRDLLDWLKSTFTLAGRSNKLQVIEVVERAIRRSGALQGAGAMKRALRELAARQGAETPADTDHVAAALDVLALVEAQANAARDARVTLAEHALRLGTTLDVLGMRPALAADAVGRAVLRELDTLAAELTGVTGRVTLEDFRALLSARFEEMAFVDPAVDSPVVMVSLSGTALRPFAAALLIGADAQHLPAARPELLFMSNAVRSELGLSTSETWLRAQAIQLAALLAATPQVIASWRAQLGDEPNSLSPLLERLQFTVERARGDNLLRSAHLTEYTVAAASAPRPAPSAPRLLPPRLSASQAQSLVNCAYQFYARRMLQLAELDDVIELPDKRDFGEALHEVLRRFHAAWGAVDFSCHPAPELAADLSSHAQAVFAPRIDGAPAMLAFQRRFEGLIAGYIEWLQQHCRDGWRWAAGEQTQRDQFTLQDGRSVELIGRVDRIDDHGDGRRMVLDYKARAANDLIGGLTEAGEDIQLPFYALLLGRRVDEAAYVSFSRAKLDDRGVATVAAPQRLDALVDSVAARLQSDLQRIADGAPLPALGVASVCKYCEMRGLCRRDYWSDEAAV